MKRLASKEQKLMVEIMLLVEQLDCVLNKAIFYQRISNKMLI
jgi:hypothetical protein